MQNLLIKLGEWFKMLAQWIGEALFDFVMWLAGLVEGLLNVALSAIGAMVPADYQPAWDSIVPYVNVLNAWVPLDYGLILLSAFVTIEISILGYRTVKKHIPTLS